jgi:hypothetical protein
LEADLFAVLIQNLFAAPTGPWRAVAEFLMARQGKPKTLKANILMFLMN